MLGTPQTCPKCGRYNKPGLKLPEECEYCGDLTTKFIISKLQQNQCPQLQKVNLLLDLKDEIKAVLEERTSWGKNQLFEVLDTIFDENLRRQ